MRLPVLCIFFGFGAVSSQAWCWGDMGHKIIGGIAESSISPKTKDFIRGILGVEPLYVAAVFPDQVRDDSRFATRTDPKNPSTSLNDFSPYHFCEIPVESNYFNRKKKIKKDCHGVLKYTKDILKNPTAMRETKMIALRYLVHVVGDIHQPLHVGNGYDRGGNECTVKTANQKTLRFHAFWDENMVELIRESFADPKNKKEAPKYYGDFLKEFKKKHANLMTETEKMNLGKGEVTDWLMESKELRETIYPDAPNAFAGVKVGEEYKHRPYCGWYKDQDFDMYPVPESAIDPTKIPTLSDDYINRFRPLAEMQIIKAGLRLAYLLDEIAKDVDENSPELLNDKKEKSILREMQEALNNIL